jgi:hypothetical protein
MDQENIFRNFCEENMHCYAFIIIFYGMNFKSKCMHENVTWNKSMKNMHEYASLWLCLEKILNDGDNLWCKKEELK